MKIDIKTIHYLNVIFLLLPVQSFASEDKTNSQTLKNASSVINHDAMSSNYLLQLIIGLFIVLICIVALAWFAKKINRYKLLTDDSLKIIGGLSMGARERVVLLQVGTEQLLLGVSPGRINTLHVLDTPIETLNRSQDNSFGKSFSDKFKTIMTDANDKKTKQQAHQATGPSDKIKSND
jgi:flagellar protein FliO/FliZ